MPSISFTSPDGSSTRVEAANGEKLMKVAKENGIAGIVGACGGHMECATCHVIVDEQHVGVVGSPSEDEDAMLDSTAYPRQTHSRLSCQIIVSDELDGISVTIAPFQR